MDGSIYDDIAPIYDHEVKTVIQDLLADPGFLNALSYLIPGENLELLKQQMLTFETKFDFQKGIIYPIVYNILHKTGSTLTSSNWENISRDHEHLFLSNHRDIILDAGILNIQRLDHDLDTTEIGIGDNLFVYPWIKQLVRLNKSFIVKRSITGREVLLASKHMAEYIHYVITEKKESIWLAQREGRAKDSNDRTQESLLKMLAMAPDNKSFIESLKELNIIPLSLSYEYDPCDYLKAQEFQQKRDNPEYKKSQRDDLINMEKGLLGYKGHIHFQFGTEINPTLDIISTEPDRRKQVELVAQAIDKQIHSNYKIFPINYIAFDLLNQTNRFASNYTSEQVAAFKQYIAGQMSKMKIENKDEAFLTTKFLEMYSNTLKNHIEATTNQ